MNIKDYTNHSGGCIGADLKWDSIGKLHGFTKHIHWRPEHLNELSGKEKSDMLAAYYSAADALLRPRQFRGMHLCQRNWIPTRNASGIYAISYILQPGQKDLQGRENRTFKETVAGGTGWAIEMAIQMDKPVFVFDMNLNIWFYWNHDDNKFVPLDKDKAPSLTQVFSGIGSRNITPAGLKAIGAVYQRTVDKISTLLLQEKLKKQV